MCSRTVHANDDDAFLNVAAFEVRKVCCGYAKTQDKPRDLARSTSFLQPCQGNRISNHGEKFDEIFLILFGGLIVTRREGDDGSCGSFACLRKRAHELLETGAKLLGVKEAEHPRKRVVARQSVFELQELPKEGFLLSCEQRHIRGILPAAQHRAQRDDHDLRQIMKPRVAVARITQFLKTSCQAFHAILQPQRPRRDG